MLTAKVLISLDLMSLPVLITLLEIKVDRAGCRDITGYNRIWHCCICDSHLYKNALLLPKDKLSPRKNNLPYFLLDIERVDPAAETGGTREDYDVAKIYPTRSEPGTLQLFANHKSAHILIFQSLVSAFNSYWYYVWACSWSFYRFIKWIVTYSVQSSFN